MIPKLYNTTYIGGPEVTLRANLVDCITCTVTEERNGAYTLEAEYPAEGQGADLIQVGNLIGAIPSQDAEEQYFRIATINRKLSEGVLEISARHISYDLAGYVPVIFGATPGFTGAACSFYLKMLVRRLYNDAEGILQPIGQAWTVGTDIPDTTLGVIINTSIRSVRSMLLGSKGSVLDVFGGEYEWGNGSVYLHQARGEDRGVYIRYGRNLTEYSKEETSDGTYTHVIGFYEDEGNPVYYPALTNNANNNSPLLSVNDYDSAEGWPRVRFLDMTDDFDERPTPAQLNTLAAPYRASTKSTISPSFETKFVDLTGTTEPFGQGGIVKLCDTVHLYYSEGEELEAKVVKTEWNVLLDRYNNITIGKITPTLADTIAENYNSTGSTGSAQAPIFYGTSTSAGTQSKSVICEGFSLRTGAILFVKFSAAQTYAGQPQLNVNNTGAVAVYRADGDAAGPYDWLAGELVGFCYTGSSFQMLAPASAGYVELSNTSVKNGTTILYRWGRFIDFVSSGDIVSLAANTWTTIGTAPEGYRPRAVHIFRVANNTRTAPIIMRIRANGVVDMFNYGTAITSATNGAFFGSYLAI